MSSAPPTPSSNKTPPQPAAKPQLVPPEERFWKKYSPHFEFPLSSVGSVALHILVIGLFIIYLAKLLNTGPDKTPVPVRTVAITSGDGDGAPGDGSGGGEPKENIDPNEQPALPKINVPTPELKRTFVSVKEWVPEIKDDPEAQAALVDSEPFKRLSGLSEDIQKKMLAGTSGKVGKGNNEGEGLGNSGKKGPGGPGSSTGERSLRWTLSFSTRDGRDYLNQLQALKATIIIPQPPDFKSAFVIKDVNQPEVREPFNGNPNGQMFFVDDNPESIAKVSAALNLNFAPPQFAAMFPKEVEAELARLERSYRGRKESEIGGTTFKILIVGGKYQITVIDQKVKRGRR